MFFRHSERTIHEQGFTHFKSGGIENLLGHQDRAPHTLLREDKVTHGHVFNGFRCSVRHQDLSSRHKTSTLAAIITFFKTVRNVSVVHAARHIAIKQFQRISETLGK